MCTLVLIGIGFQIFEYWFLATKVEVDEGIERMITSFFAKMNSKKVQLLSDFTKKAYGLIISMCGMLSSR